VLCAKTGDEARSSNHATIQGFMAFLLFSHLVRTGLAPWERGQNLCPNESSQAGE
jgi:hypothetical protein